MKYTLTAVAMTENEISEEELQQKIEATGLKDEEHFIAVTQQVAANRLHEVFDDSLVFLDVNVERVDEDE